MESVCIRFEDKFLKNIMRVMGRFGYSTKTEFIRESIRDKIKDLEKKEALIRLEKVYGASKHKTSDKDLHKAREKAVKEIAKELGVDV